MADDLLTTWAAAKPDAVAVIEDDTSLTFTELEALANRWGHVLQDLGVRAGTKIVWCGQNGFEVVAIVAAARKAGAVAVPLNYRLTSEEAGYVIDNADATVVLFDLEQLGQLEPCRAACPKVTSWVAYRTGGAALPEWAGHLETLGEAASPKPVSPIGSDTAAGATMIYTSGTTGKPKGALRNTGSNPETGAALVALIGYVPEDNYLTTGPLYHSGPLGFMGIVQGRGGAVIVQRQFDPRRWLELVEKHRITTTFSAPTPIRRILDLPKEVLAAHDTSSLQRVIANAAPWPFELKRRYVEAFGDTSLWEVYGSTELGVNTVLAPADQLRKPGSCGRPAPLVEVALFDDDGNEVTEVRQPGELFVRSAGSFDTYYKAEEKFEESRRGDWLTVGDIAYRDEEGFLYICDRKKDMIISGGVNIYPAEVEAGILEHPDVVDAAVFGIPSEEWGEAVHAVIAVREGADPTDAELEAFARGILASYKVPRSWSRIDEIPRTASGKILKRELREPYWAGRDSKVG